MSRFERILICYGALIGLIGTVVIVLGIAAASDRHEAFSLAGAGAAMICPSSLCAIWGVVSPLLAYERWRRIPLSCAIANGVVLLSVVGLFVRGC